MRKISLTAMLLLLAFIGFAQEPKENGIIYITHPYIDAVNKATKAYLEKDAAADRQLYADTAEFWASGMDKPVKLEEAIKMWVSDFDFYDDIKITTVGYPDYLHYKDKDQKYVQSWGVWSGKSKKTGNVVKIDFIQLDKFNDAGKIEFESVYGDFSKMVKE